MDRFDVDCFKTLEYLVDSKLIRLKNVGECLEDYLNNLPQLVVVEDIIDPGVCGKIGIHKLNYTKLIYTYGDGVIFTGTSCIYVLEEIHMRLEDNTILKVLENLGLINNKVILGEC